MGNLKSPISDVRAIADRIRKEIPQGPFFEFGDDPEIVVRIEGHLHKLRRLLIEMGKQYESQSMEASKPYFAVMEISSEMQNFVVEVQEKGMGKRENTSRLCDFIRALETQTAEWAGMIDPGVKNDIHGMGVSKLKVNQFHNAFIPSVAMEEPRRNLTNSQSSALARKQRNNFAVNVGKLILFPKAMGQFIFDVLGRTPKDSSSMIMGWLVVIIIILLIVFVVLLVTGQFKIEMLINMIKVTWRFFKPVQ